MVKTLLNVRRQANNGFQFNSSQNCKLCMVTNQTAWPKRLHSNIPLQLYQIGNEVAIPTVTVRYLHRYGANNINFRSYSHRCIC